MISPEIEVRAFCVTRCVAHDARHELAALLSVEKIEGLRHEMCEKLVRMSRSTRKLTHAR
jgi:hypothetical protein